jgi:hypothetical protein
VLNNVHKKRIYPRNPPFFLFGERELLTWRNLADAAVTLNDDVGGEGGVEGLVGAVVQQQVGLPHLHGRHSNILVGVTTAEEINS